jgi:predicted RNA-binding Zn ribbon-like protein
LVSEARRTETTVFRDIILDVSRNRSRRWCTMEVCGTHEKMRRYVAKRAARRDSERRGDA